MHTSSSLWCDLGAWFVITEEVEEPRLEGEQSLKGTKRLREEEEEEDEEYDDDYEDDEEAGHGKGEYDDEPLDKRKWMTEEQVT